jgi:hypothetical protein
MDSAPPWPQRADLPGGPPRVMAFGYRLLLTLWCAAASRSNPSSMLTRGT